MKKHLLSLIALLLVSVASCAVETESADEAASPTPAATTSMPQSLAAPPATGLEPIRTAACDRIWECERCGTPNRTRNVLVEYCDDGTQRNIIVGACGQPCF